MTWTVLKLGGTSVSSVTYWDQVAVELRQRLDRGERVLVVQSALAKVTDLLERLLDADDATRAALLIELKDRHARLAAEMKVDVALLAPRFERLARLTTGAALIGEVTPRVRAEVLAHGELMASELSAGYLARLGLPVEWWDARELLQSVPAANQTDRAASLSAICDTAEDSGLVARLAAGPPLKLTQGFIARNAAGDTVVLGRGGSDTSGAYFAAKLGAALLEIWTDVPGMYTADPRLVGQARLLKALDYDEAQEIASTGAKVLHPRCLEPVRRHGIPLTIRCTPNPAAPGTHIGAHAGATGGRVKAISVRKGVTLVSMETVGMWQQVGFLADVFACFKRHGLSVDLVSTSETCVTASLDEAANAATAGQLERLATDLGALCKPRIIRGCAAVSVVGRRMRANLHRLAPALELFEEREVFLVSQAANDLNFTFVVEEAAAERAAKALHALLIPQGAEDATFGARWDADRPVARTRTPWWVAERTRLLELATRGTPVYAYSAASVRSAVAELKALKSIDRVLYAMKANPHPGLLRLMAEAGVGFECVSPGELARVNELAPGTDPLFTPNFAPRAEYQAALAAGITVTLDNLHCLEHWGADFAGRAVFLRLDPGQGAGHHRHVRTAGTLSKFGIPFDELDRVTALTREHGVTVIGLHAHLGSGIVEADAWRAAGARLLSAAERFPALKVLDLGGGLGLPDRPGAEGLDLAQLELGLAELKRARPDLALWLEPGRFLVARAGVLLTRVTQRKGKAGELYVGVDAGMNSLIRPALYGAHHEILNLTRLEQAATETATVVGPICESGDVLGRDRRLPPCQEGDVLLIADTGAYGAAMASSYNLRAPAVEVVLD
jgi:diaminopimelate decarboxylase/aspartate kinase